MKTEMFVAVRVDGEPDAIGFSSLKAAEDFCKLHLVYSPISSWSVDTVEEAQEFFA